MPHVRRRRAPVLGPGYRDNHVAPVPPRGWLCQSKAASIRRHLNGIPALHALETLAPKEGLFATNPDELNAAEDVAKADDKAGRVKEVCVG